MRLSSSLPPAGFTRAEPRPPRRPSRPALVTAALVLGAGLLLTAGFALTRTAPARTVTPDAATPVPSAEPSSLRSVPRTAGPRETSSAHRGRAPGRPPHRMHAVPSRTKHRPARPPRPRATRKPRTARPRHPSWIAAECRRRFPDDPLRRNYCVAALERAFGG